MGKKEQKMKGSMNLKTVVTSTFTEKCVFRWFIHKYDFLELGRLYYEVFTKYGYSYEYKLIKTSDNLYIAFQCNYSNAHGRYISLDGNCYSEEVRTIEISDGLYVGIFPKSILLNKKSSYWESGVLKIGFRFITDISTTVQYNRSGEIGPQSDTDQLCHDMQNVFINSKNSDFTFNLDDGCIKAHKSVLYARSNFFKEFFSLDEEACEFTVADITQRTMYNVLLYVYSAELCDTRIDNMVKLLEVAYLFKISSLKERCIDYFDKTDSWKAIEDLEFFEYKVEEKLD